MISWEWSSAIALSLVKLITERTFFPLTSPTQMKFQLLVKTSQLLMTVIATPPHHAVDTVADVAEVKVVSGDEPSQT